MEKHIEVASAAVHDKFDTVATGLIMPPAGSEGKHIVNSMPNDELTLGGNVTAERLIDGGKIHV